MRPLKAKLPADNVYNGKNLSADKELVRSYNVVAIHKGEFRDCITVRCWMGRSRNASVTYATIWAQGPQDRSFMGHGRAGGYGYHRVSAAIQEAITSAGIELFGSPYSSRGEKPNFRKRACIAGVGDSAVRHALEAIARALGYRKFTIIENA